jgi:hypothetical protein
MSEIKSLLDSSSSSTYSLDGSILISIQLSSINSLSSTSNRVILFLFLKIAVSCKMTFRQIYKHPRDSIFLCHSQAVDMMSTSLKYLGLQPNIELIFSLEPIKTAGSPSLLST